MGLDITGIGAVSDLIRTGIDKIWPDKSEAERAQATLLLAQVQGQIDTNKAEAASSSVFVAGWRPSVGWVCSAALAWQLILAPSIQWGATIYGKPVVLPPLDTETLISLLFALLGIGGMRTVEKLNGVASK